MWRTQKSTIIFFWALRMIDLLIPPGMENFWDFTDPFVVFWQSIFRLPDDMMRLSICLIATYPAVLIHRFVLPGHKSRLVYSLFVGLFWAFFCFKWDALYYVVTGLLCYLTVWFLPTKQSPFLVILISFGILSYGYDIFFCIHYIIFFFFLISSSIDIIIVMLINIYITLLIGQHQ